MSFYHWLSTPSGIYTVIFVVAIALWAPLISPIARWQGKRKRYFTQTIRYYRFKQDSSMQRKLFWKYAVILPIAETVLAALLWVDVALYGWVVLNEAFNTTAMPHNLGWTFIASLVVATIQKLDQTCEHHKDPAWASLVNTFKQLQTAKQLKKE